MPDSKQREASPCSLKSVPVPEFITCTRCGDDIEIWTDEEETACRSCGHRVFRKEATLH